MTSITGHVVHLEGEAQTEALARRISLWARPGLLITLSGDVGAGKSTFARAFIRALFKPGFDTDVPSPTFSLIQTYDETRVPVFHADVYRVKSSDEIAELGFEDLLQNHCGLVEWPEKLGGQLTDDVLHIEFSGAGQRREVRLAPQGLWTQLLQRDATIEQFLTARGADVQSRQFFEGDASSRRYETVLHKGQRVLLMDMPQRPDGPPVQNGKPYSQIAHLAENISSVVFINNLLGTFIYNYSAPKVFSPDLKAGLALIEDIGDKVFGKMLLAGEDMTEPMLTAAALLADMGHRPWSNKVEFLLYGTYVIPPYDMQAMLIEVDLLPSWFWRHVHGSPPPAEINESFQRVWKTLLPQAQPEHPQLVMRDFHSPNLIWIPTREGIKRVGLIDTQDAVMGHGAYDLVSLIQDARVDIPEALATRTLQHYLELRAAKPVIALRTKAAFDAEEFMTAYAVLGAQRATKILGIFARLNMRDGKPAYLKHMPRVSRYLKRNLEHPALKPLLDWYHANLPEALSVSA